MGTNEKNTFDYFNKVIGGGLRAPDNEFSLFDAYFKDSKGQKCIVEFKHRYTYYADKWFEAHKYERNAQYAKIHNMKYYYIIEDSFGVWCLDVLKHERAILRIVPKWMMAEATTMIANGKKAMIPKLAYMIPEKYFFKV